MYMEQIIYHGSNVEVSKPRILQNGFYKDFGYGFYCTNMKRQAKRWAMTRRGKTVVNYYKYIKFLAFINLMGRHRCSFQKLLLI